MIRVEITKTEWRTDGGVLCIDKPVDVEAEVPVVETQRTLLVQEFTDLPLEPIIALLNRLQEAPLCRCGHQRHEGRCQAIVSSGAMYSSADRCDCQRYETRGKAEFREFREKAEKENATLQGRLSEVIQQRERLHSDVARLTRSRDSLLRRSKKSGAKRR